MEFSLDKENTTILIADDEPTNRYIIKLALSQDGYKLIEAKNGEEAIQLAKKHYPDVILMDAMMPKVNGFIAIEEIKKDPNLSNIPILMITALDTQKDKIKAFESGANDYLSKPFDLQELRLRVKSFAQLRYLYIQNIKARLDPNYNLPNIQALREKLEEITYPTGIFIQIKEFEDIVYLYGLENSKIIIKQLINHIKQKLPYDVEIFTISEDKFVFFWNCNTKFPKDELLNLIKFLYEDIKKMKFGQDLLQTDLKVSIVGNTIRKDFIQIGILSLKEINKKNIPYIIANNIYIEMTKSIENTISTVILINEAIKEDRVIPVYQAILDAKTNKINKYECLVRIKRKDGSLMSPFFFLETAKKSEQYINITKIMIEKTFKYMSSKQCDFSINLSSLDMEDEGLLQFLFDKIKQYNVNNHLIIELLEDESIHNFDVVLSFIKKMRKIGIRVAIDDYGSGYSNLERIFQFKPDFLKIDGSIIKGIIEDETKLAIAKSAVFLSKQLGIYTVGEFISNEDLFNKAKEIGIDYLQGYYIKEPKEEI